jgi:hypothetical protein
MEAIQKLVMYGFPDRVGLCLYSFQSQLLALLRQTEDHSYAFVWGKFGEVDHCDRRGDFARKLSAQSLEALVSWCRKAEPINWIKATDIANGLPINEEVYLRQPGDVRIYNPEGLPLSQILLQDDMLMGKPVRVLAFDPIDTAGMRIFLPRYYAATLTESNYTGHVFGHHQGASLR